MTRLKMHEGYAMPPDRAIYPPLPTFYRDVRFQMLYFRAAEERVLSCLPEPLEPAPGGLCVVFTIDVPFSSDYGPFQESGIAAQVLFNGQTGFYISHVFLNNVPAILSGRERWGTPKVFAEVKLEQHENILTGVTVKDGIRLITLTSQIGKPAEAHEMTPLFPCYRLKIIPKADGPGAAIKQLVTAAPEDTVIHLLYKGIGTVEVGRTASVDLSGFAPIEFFDAFYYVASYTESYGEVVYDYLQNREKEKR